MLYLLIVKNLLIYLLMIRIKTKKIKLRNTLPNSLVRINHNKVIKKI